MTKKLRISTTRGLPLDFVTKTAAILAQRRKGKTYTASVLAEEMVAARQPFVALDPTGAWWGLRASLDGQSDGLPVIVLGGQHGDVPLERTGGKVVADLVVDEPGYYVVDFSLFESGEAERQFAVDFAERLYRAKGQPGKDFPLHLFVDEADRFIPQNLRSGSNETSPRLLGAFEAIVRRGGLRGLGTTLISQRAAVVNKNVLEMIDVLIALRTVGPNDRDAVLGYVSAHGSAENVKLLKNSLASLEIGEAWLWEPGADPALFERIKIRERHTFNSSATPKPGEKRVEPKRLAAVDLAALQRRMAETIERAKADDPKALRAEVAELKRQLAKPLKPPTAVIVAPPERVEVPTFSEDEFGDLFESLSAEIDGVIKRASETKATIGRALVNYRQLQRAAVKAGPKAIGRVKSIGHAPEAARAAPSGPPKSIGSFGPGETATLIAAAQHTSGVTRDQLSILTGYKRSTRDTYVQRLRAAEMVSVEGATIRATASGLKALGDSFERLPTGDRLREHWLANLPDGEATVLRLITASWPHAVTRDTLTEKTEYKRSTRDTYIQRLKTRKLVTVERGEVRASSELFE